MLESGQGAYQDPKSVPMICAAVSERAWTSRLASLPRRCSCTKSKLSPGERRDTNEPLETSSSCTAHLQGQRSTLLCIAAAFVPGLLQAIASLHAGEPHSPLLGGQGCSSTTPSPGYGQGGSRGCMATKLSLQTTVLAGTRQHQHPKSSTLMPASPKHVSIAI